MEERVRIDEEEQHNYYVQVLVFSVRYI
jgi:hypothetical protein